MTFSSSCSLPRHNLFIDCSSVNGTQVCSFPVVPDSHSDGLPRWGHQSGIVSGSALSAYGTTECGALGQVAFPLRHSKHSSPIPQSIRCETSVTGLSPESVLSPFGSGTSQFSNTRPLPPSHRNAVTAAEINKLHQAVKLFRLLPTKTQMILKQVHPEGPLNSDIFAAIMAATECVPQASAYPLGATPKPSGSREKHSKSRQTLPSCAFTAPHLLMQTSFACDRPTRSVAETSAPLTSISGSGQTERAKSTGSQSVPRKAIGTSTNSMTLEQIKNAERNIPAGGLGAQTHGPLGANVFVFHIPNEWVERDLALHFAQFGPILSARIAADKVSGRRLGFGFVSFTTVSAARIAVDTLNGFNVAGKRLKVTIKRGEQQFAGAGEAPKLEVDPPKSQTAKQTKCSDALSSSPREILQASGEESAGSSTDTDKRHSKWNRSNPDDVGSSVPTGANTGEGSSANTSSSDLSSSDPRQKRTFGVCEQCRKSLCATSRPRTPETQHCAALKVLERLQIVNDVLTKVYERIGSASPPLPDEMWLDTLTNLLRTEPGRYFIFTLLMAAGLGLENGVAERDEHCEDDCLSSSSSSGSSGERSSECGAPA